jgi:broad specificity phosphatase PhoE
MTTFYLVQHAEKQRKGGDPGLTVTGRAQALWTGSCLRGKGIDQVWTSPSRRARETAEIIAAVLGLPVRTDARLRERMTWDGVLPLASFFADWEKSTEQRDYRPPLGDSSREAGQRFEAFLTEHADDRGRIAIVSHGGVTVDLLRNLYGEELLADRPELIGQGVPACGITRLAVPEPPGPPVLEDLANDSHLRAADAPTGAFVHQLTGYRPRWLYTAREILDVHGRRLGELVDQRLVRTWLVWDTDADDWFAEGPIVFEFENTRLTVCHRTAGECSLSWDDLDPADPIDPGDESLRLAWRSDPYPVLAEIAGQRLRLLDLIETGDADDRWMIEAVEFSFTQTQCRLYNVSGRNALAAGPTAVEARRRVRVA